jgi:uncharacterized protein YkwD
MKLAFTLALCALAIAGSAHAQSTPAAPAAMISNFRLQHGEGRVTLDSTLTRIAHDQASAMASKDILDHDVLGPFTSRAAPSNSGHAAENIAYGYDGFPKTLDQWINSPEHRKNLLLHDATRVGVANARSEKTHRTYWAMVIAGGYERPPSRSPAVSTPAPRVKPSPHAKKETCRFKLLGLCL